MCRSNILSVGSKVFREEEGEVGRDRRELLGGGRKGRGVWIMRMED